MITINENRKRLVGEIYDYVHRLVDKSIKNDWEIIIWGFGRGGKFLRHLIQDVDGRVKVSFIIDEKKPLVFDSEPMIYRSTLLNYIDSSRHMILSSIKDMGQIEEKLSHYGYNKGKNLYDVYEDIGDSYLEFLHKKNEAVEFGRIAKADMEGIGSDCNEHTPADASCVDSIFEAIYKLEANLSFFDFGCGKGAAILMAYMVGFDKVGGVELSQSVYDQCVINMRELEIDCELLNEDATKCNVDEYNCFFLYNPFRGAILERVLHNIRESFLRYKRKIYLVYANPFDHMCIIEGGFFKLFKQMRTDFYDPLLNIYVIDDEFFKIN